jgi:hypothetical protein
VMDLVSLDLLQCPEVFVQAVRAAVAEILEGMDDDVVGSILSCDAQLSGQDTISEG